MTHLVNQDEDGKADAELCSVNGPVNAHEGKQTQEEIDFQQNEKRFAFGEQEGDGRKRAELADPIGRGLPRRCRGRGQFEFACLIAHPFGLGGFARQELECFQPLSPGLDQVAVFFHHFCGGGEALQFLGVHERVALRAHQGAERECTRTVFAIFN